MNSQQTFLNIPNQCSKVYFLQISKKRVRLQKDSKYNKKKSDKKKKKGGGLGFGEGVEEEELGDGVSREVVEVVAVVVDLVGFQK